MNIKRIISALIGLPLVILFLTIPNDYIADVAFTWLASMCLYEFYKAFSTKHKPIQWIGYLSTIVLLGFHIFLDASLINVLILVFFISFILIFLQVFNKKIDIIDASITLLGIFYITLFTLFLPLTKNLPNGNILVWYVFVSAWGTDVFAYIVGKNFGKHHFIEISPKKTIEGSVAGIIGAVVCMLIATYIMNTFCKLNISYWMVTIISIVLSLVSQIGDLAASSIKRYCDIKDFGTILPGHGGILDRFDSVIFTAPIAYLLISIL